jgi:hypothetical protein
MLKITVELISAIDGSRDKKWEGLIYNDGTGTPERGNYVAAFGPKGGKIAALAGKYGTRQRGWRYARFKDFPRKRLGVWDLLGRLLNQEEPLTDQP